MADRDRDERPEIDEIRGIASDEEPEFDAAEDLDDEEEDEDDEEGTF